MTDNDSYRKDSGDYLAFSFDSSGDHGNSSRRQNNFRGKNYNRSRHGFGYNSQQNNRHTPYQNNRRSFEGSPDHRQQNQRRDQGNSYNIQDYVHPSMVEDPWEHLYKRKKLLEDSVTETVKDTSQGSDDNDQDLAKPLDD